MYSRIRVGTPKKLGVELEVDAPAGAECGFVEAEYCLHKGAGWAPDRMLPIVGLATGLTGKPWATAWLAARKALGIVADPRWGIQPALDSSGGSGPARWA